MITKEAKQSLPDDLIKELMKVSELAPVAPPPPEKYLIAIYALISNWSVSDEWEDIKGLLRTYRREHLTKQTKKNRFSTVIEITAPGVKPSNKSKYVTILQHALTRGLTVGQLKKQLKKHGINDFVEGVRTIKKKRSQRASRKSHK
jgi:hypothetical protein